MINLYEFECLKCDAIMQVQLSDYLRNGLVCVCGSGMSLVFHTEIDEPVFTGEESYEEMDVQMHDMPDNVDN